MSDKRVSRRGFISTVGAAAASALVNPGLSMAGERPASRLGNLHPGVVGIAYNPSANIGVNGNLPVQRTMVDDALMAITGETSAVAAMSQLLTGGTTGKKVAVKVNCINGSVPTRWEMVRAILERLLDAGISPANMVIFDNQDLNGCGFNATNFPNAAGQQFQGLQFLGTGSCPYPVPGTTCSLSTRIVNCDYLVNCPVLKGHWLEGVGDPPDFHFTLSLKNHYGSISGLTHTWPDFREMLGRISADPVHVRPKTILVALSAVFGYYSINDPGGSAENWTTFAGTHPKRVILSTDPISVDHIGIEMINHERVLHGLTAKTDTYVEYAATTFGLGIHDFASMTCHQWMGIPFTLSVAPQGLYWRLTWAAMNGAYGYRIYRSTNAYGPWSLLTDITSPSTVTWDETTTPPTSGFFYRVEAYNAFGAMSSDAVGIFPFSLP
ncbi:MAG: DUF362 domain-containing protein [Candidatus Eisenbacteria bacterium]|nr:DUF362 domain-containing protein [Candidatus Eisenbacteria bacterium]